MKIKCVEIGQPRDGLAWSSWVDEQGRFAMPSVGLVSVASLVDESFDVEILDEKVSGIPEKLGADIVAMSFKTMHANSAYALADSLRSQGTRVVMGGVHASAVPETAAQHADAVVAGEGEAVWPQVLSDIKRGSVQRIYRAPAMHYSLDEMPRQRVELVDHPRYMLHAVQSARGCSFNCEFCPTRAIFGEGFRLRKVGAVVEEVERLLAIDDKPIFFTENVFGAGDTTFIARLTEQLYQRSVRYGVICDWYMLNEEIVSLLAAGGCGLVCLNLTGRLEEKEIAALEAVRRADLTIWGYFMFGFEEDSPDVFQRAVDRVRDYEIECATLTVLTPFPGTPMGQRLAEEGRIFSRDLDLYDHIHVHFEPKSMTADQLREGFEYVCNEVGEKMSFARAAEVLHQR